MMVMMLIAFKDLRERLRIFLGLAVVHIVRRVRAEHGRWRSTGMVLQADETPSRRFTLPYGIQRVYLARGVFMYFPARISVYVAREFPHPMKRVSRSPNRVLPRETAGKSEANRRKA